MPKLPKLSDLTDVSGMVNRVKSAIDNLTGPSTSSATEEALSKESDPTKVKLLEVELLINQLHDVTVIQNKTLHELKTAYAEVKKLATEALAPAETEKAEPKKTEPEKASTEKSAAEAKPVELKKPSESE